MENLRDISAKISSSLIEWKKELDEQKKSIIVDIEHTTEDMKVASAMGDRSENAAFTTAVEKLSQLNTQLTNVSKQLRDLANVDDTKEYEHIGVVVMYSTVRLSMNGEEFIYKLYPGKLSSMERRILAQESKVGRSIWMKRVGDVFAVEHRITKDPVVYRIEEIY